jgi:hypothetical protein
MPLEPIAKLLEAARQGGYALGYFESWSVDSLQGVIDAAEKVRAPIIIGFNGDFLSHPGRKAGERLAWYAALGRAAAATAKVPCGLIFNECPTTAGCGRRPRPASIWSCRPIPRPRTGLRKPGARNHGSRSSPWRRSRGRDWHAAERGRIPHAHASAKTDPELAARFVAATQVDLLGVSVGNVHIKLDGYAALDLEHLERIWRHVSVPFVLHGGTGIEPNRSGPRSPSACARSITAAPISNNATSRRSRLSSAAASATRTRCWALAGRTT